MDPAANSSSEDSSSENRHVADLVREAILTINDGNGVDIDGIYDFVKARHDALVPNYRQVLEVELNTRVSENKLEKVDNLYRIIDVVSSENTHDETTEAESEEPVAVPHPSRSSSWETHDGDMVVITIRTLNDGNGADIDEIFDYIQDNFPLAECDRNLLEIELNDRAYHNELEKVDDTRYKVVNVTSENTHETTETKSKSVGDSDVQKDPATSASDYALPYGDMPEAIVIEAISTMDYGVGVHIDEIYQFIENRYIIPTDYMKMLEEELNKRVSENELEQGEYGYRIVVDVTSENMDESQSQAVAVDDQKDPAKSSSSSSDASASSGNTPLYDPVIEAISTINDGNGVDIDGILEFIQAKYQRTFSPNYRKNLEGGLKRRVSQCILEKVETHYKILDITPEKLDEISEAAAKALAVSDQKDLEAKEASEAADRAKKVLEENELVLQVAKETLGRYTRGN